MRKIARLAMGCCCAALVACGGTPEAPVFAPTPQPSSFDLPRFRESWDEEFAAHITVERVTIDGSPVLVPKGLKLPSDVHVVAATEATLLLADDPSHVLDAVSASLRDAGYEPVAESDDVRAWAGHGMAVRLEVRDDAQLVAWAPESMLSGLVDAP